MTSIIVSTLEDARRALRTGSAAACSPLAGEPNRLLSDLVGGNAKNLTDYARHMRKAPTPWEQKLWARLKNNQLGGYKFRRQAPVDHYIADFVNYEKRIIVELDGSQHVESNYDKQRDAYLCAEGFNVLRFWNNELDANPNSVLEHILKVLEDTPHRNALTRFDSPAGGEWEPVALPLTSKIELCSPPFAACHAGVNYYRHLVDALAAEFPDVDFTFTLCCGDDAVIAHDALRLGFASIICDCGEGQFAQLQALAAAVGAQIARHA